MIKGCIKLHGTKVCSLVAWRWPCYEIQQAMLCFCLFQQTLQMELKKNGDALSTQRDLALKKTPEVNQSRMFAVSPAQKMCDGQMDGWTDGQMARQTRPTTIDTIQPQRVKATNNWCTHLEYIRVHRSYKMRGFSILRHTPAYAK